MGLAHALQAWLPFHPRPIVEYIASLSLSSLMTHLIALFGVLLALHVVITLVHGPLVVHTVKLLIEMSNRRKRRELRHKRRAASRTSENNEKETEVALHHDHHYCYHPQQKGNTNCKSEVEEGVHVCVYTMGMCLALILQVTVRILCVVGCNIDHRDAEGSSLLHHACRRGDQDTAALLIRVRK